MIAERLLALSSLGVATWVAMIGPVQDESGAAPVAWEGPGAHLHAVGTVGGESLAIEARGADAIDAIGLSCDVRETRSASIGGGRPMGIAFDARVDGETRRYELAFAGHAVERVRDGMHLHVAPLGAVPTESDSSVAFALEWRASSSPSAPRQGRASETGAFHRVELHRPDAEDADVLAGYLRASWSDGSTLDLSFTVPCRR